jgi:hypothetical protein
MKKRNTRTQPLGRQRRDCGRDRECESEGKPRASRRRRTLTPEEKDTLAARTRLNELRDWAGPYSVIRTPG